MMKPSHVRFLGGLDGSNEFVTSALPLFASFCAHILALGVAMSNGMFYPIFLETFSSGKALTAWSCSLGFTVLLLTGPLASMLIHKVGIRKAAIIGGAISSLGLLVTAFAPNIYVVFAFMGIVTGFGYGIMWNTAIEVVVLSFNKYRTIAVSLSVTGAGIGAFLYPILVNYVIDIYGWRGTILLTSGLSLHLCVCGALMKTTKDRGVRTATRTIQGDTELPHDTTAANMDAASSMSNSGDLCEGEMLSCTDNDRDDFNDALDSHHADTIIRRKCLSMDRFSVFYYILLHVNNFLVCVGESIVFTHTTAYAMSMGCSPHRSRVLMSALGISSILGRVVLGLISHHRSVDVQLLYLVSFIVTAAATLVMTFWTSYAGLFFSIALFGVFFSPICALLPEVTHQIVGGSNFNYAFGFLMLTNGLGFLVGAPLAGWMYEVTQKYDNAFYLGSAAFLLSGLVLIPPWAMRKISPESKTAM